MTTWHNCMKAVRTTAAHLAGPTPVGAEEEVLGVASLPPRDLSSRLRLPALCSLVGTGSSWSSRH